MSLDKSSHTPLYVQLREIIKNKILSGILKPGDFMQTEAELCEEYELSRYPVRQALGELVEEGYLQRIRGRGTVISAALPEVKHTGGSRKLGIVLSSLTSELQLNILAGFEKSARSKGYITIVANSESSPSEEENHIEKLSEESPAGIFVFPCNKSNIKDKMQMLREKNIVVGIFDRNPGLSDIDYVGSDNFGGSYSATRHLAERGFENFIFISTKEEVSSINERLKGYLKALDDFGLSPVPPIWLGRDISVYNKYKEKFFIDILEQYLDKLKSYFPLGIFAVNDAVALYCLKLFRENGFEIGKDVAIVGFDNIMEAQFSSPPLTTVAQNGFLLGQNAAQILIGKAGGSRQIYKTIIPTQLIIRNSCGE